VDDCPRPGTATSRPLSPPVNPFHFRIRPSFRKRSGRAVVDQDLAVATAEPSSNPVRVGKEDPTLNTIHTRTEGAVLFAEIDSPPMNLIGPELVAALVSLIEVLDRGDKYKVVVFSSADPDYFIPHVDVTKIAEYRKAAEKLTGEASLGLLLRRLSETKAVTIAQVEGRVRGAGNEFILACDMRFASKERAVFGQFEAGFGLVPGAGGVQHLTRLLGRGRALEAILSAADYDATTAERYGWVNRALPDAELRPYVDALAKRIASFPSAGLQAVMERINAISLADAADYRVDSDLFGKGAMEPETQSRMRALFQAGMQTRGDVEMNFGNKLGELGSAP
jgi:enoyl-CoA hydratase/carnithine racemase